MRQAGFASGLTVAVAVAIWRGVLDPAASPFLVFLLLGVLLTGLFDLKPQDVSERQTV